MTDELAATSTPAQQFVHLRVHSEYSLVDGTVRLKPMFNACVEQGMGAIALTDQTNMFALVRFYGQATKNGVKPLFGTELRILEEDGQLFPLVLLCLNDAGYLNVKELISRAFQEGQNLGPVPGQPVVPRHWLQGATEGVVALSGGRLGLIGQLLLAAKPEQAVEQLQALRAIFPEGFYLELQRTGRADEESYIGQAVQLASAEQVPLVATNDVRFMSPDDFAAHDVRVAIHDGFTLDDPNRPRQHSEQQYLRSPQEMVALFADIPQAISNTVAIAQRCNVSLDLGKNFLPDFPIPEGLTINEFLTLESEKGLEVRFQQLFDTQAEGFAEIAKPYHERLAFELKTIIDMGFPGYFLIVADFIRWAKENGVPVGPGRGSGAGSLVAYALGITDLDPLAYDLLFERFLNPERVSMPDFDVDFCMEGRDRVIEYVAQTYGRDKVSQIITFGTMAAKAVVRDVGRVLGHPYGFVDRVAKQVPFELGMTLAKALKESEELAASYETDEEVKDLIDMGLSLEGVARNAGKHAGGVVISPSKLTDFAPLYCEADGRSLVTQFDKDDVEAVGLVKFDFLGLRTLTIIDWAVQTINRNRAETGEEALDVLALPMDDAAAFKLLQAKDTTAVFQLESRGMKELIGKLKPDCFEDIVALVALFRPGPLQSGMVDDFIERKHGADVSYPHPDYNLAELEPVLKPTYGIILYQEQVMQIAQVLAGYSLGGADLLRRAMGKKKPEEMQKQREIFTTGSVERELPEETATFIFDLMEKFAGYGFNKSHSAAYALLSYQTAWLKAHYPAEFMAAVLSADMDNTDKVVVLIEDCAIRKLEVLPPDINESAYQFSAVNSNNIRYGLGAIKGVGQSAIDGMLAERDANGRFADLQAFCQRVDLRKVNRRVMEAMIRAGALDSLANSDEIDQARAELITQLPEALKVAEQSARNEQAGQNDLFGLGGGSAVQPVQRTKALMVQPWSTQQRLTAEKETLGLWLTGHPINEYLGEIRQFCSSTIGSLLETDKPADGQGFGYKSRPQVLVAGLIVSLRTNANKRAFVTLDDRSGRIEMPLFSDKFEQYRALLVKDALLIVDGTLSWDTFNDSWRVNANQLMSLDEARAIYARRLLLNWPAQLQLDAVKRLQHALQPHAQGKCPVLVEYQNDQASAQISLGREWAVTPTQSMLDELLELMGKEGARLHYRAQAPESGGLE